MPEVPGNARVVVIGAGIVGNSLVYHLATLGWRDIVQIDKGPLPNPGGSTGHASNFIFPVDHSREITDLTLDSMRQYKEMGVFTESGGFEVARTEERMEELRRRMSSAKAWGIPAELVTPEQVVERVPFLDPSVIVGAFWTPSVGVVDSLRAGTIMRERAMELNALTVVPGTTSAKVSWYNVGGYNLVEFRVTAISQDLLIGGQRDVGWVTVKPENPCGYLTATVPNLDRRTGYVFSVDAVVLRRSGDGTHAATIFRSAVVHTR